MSKTSSDKTKYFRTGIAIPLARKVTFDERLAALGLKTIGDLTTLFVTAPGVVEALKPIAEQFRIQQEQDRADSPERKKLVDKLKAMKPDELQALLDLASAQKAA